MSHLVYTVTIQWGLYSTLHTAPWRTTTPGQCFIRHSMPRQPSAEAVAVAVAVLYTAHHATTTSALHSIACHYNQCFTQHSVPLNPVPCTAQHSTTPSTLHCKARRAARTRPGPRTGLLPPGAAGRRPLPCGGLCSPTWLAPRYTALLSYMAPRYTAWPHHARIFQPSPH
jgi:hypothetical protein